MTSVGCFFCFAAWRLLIFFKSHFQTWIFLYLLPVTHQFCHIKFWQYLFYLFLFLYASLSLYCVISFSRLIPFFPLELLTSSFFLLMVAGIVHHMSWISIILAHLDLLHTGHIWIKLSRVPKIIVKFKMYWISPISWKTKWVSVDPRGMWMDIK